MMTQSEQIENAREYIRECELCETECIDEHVAYLVPSWFPVDNSMADEWKADGQHYCFLCEDCQEEATED